MRLLVAFTAAWLAAGLCMADPEAPNNEHGASVSAAAPRFDFPDIGKLMGTAVRAPSQEKEEMPIVDLRELLRRIPGGGIPNFNLDTAASVADVKGNLPHFEMPDVGKLMRGAQSEVVVGDAFRDDSGDLPTINLQGIGRSVQWDGAQGLPRTDFQFACDEKS
jgi:hypothetical protein